MSLAALPFVFLRFWYVESPREIIAYFWSLDISYFHLFSVPLLLRTFFQPIKNEYREGLVGFSVAMGIVVKSALILASLVFIIPIILAEIGFLITYLMLPGLSLLILLLKV